MLLSMRAGLLFTIVTLAALAGCLLFLLLREKKRHRAATQALELAKHEHLEQMSSRTQLDDVKNEFISTVSHELRTPLTSIRGALGLLSAGLLGNNDPKAQNLLRIALTNTDRLIRLINDILDLERIQSGRSPLRTSACSLAAIVEHSVDDLMPLAAEAHVHIEVTPPSDASPGIQADPDRIGQVVTNLLSNAIKFSDPGSSIRIKTEIHPTTILLRVIDSGRGIPEGKLDLIFDRFQQVEPSDSRQKGGTGLGLTISRGIIQQHGGRIWAEQNEGPGATFLVELPRSKTVPPVFESSPLAMPPTSDGRAMVLVCDDDASVRAIVRLQLELHDYIVVEAARGEQAVAFASQHPVSAILLDLHMPGLSGWETLQKLRGTPATSHIPVVILTVTAPETRSPLDPAAQGWIQKPFHEEFLLSELSRVLENSSAVPSILLVEDDIDLAEVVRIGFLNTGVIVHHVATLKAAVEYCALSRPHVLLLDLSLPDGDGFSLIRTLRENDDLRFLPVVVYSGRDFTDQEKSGPHLAPTHFLTKAGVHPHEVQSLVLAMVGRQAISQQTVLTPDAI
jgi:signal transduction histidine kinase/CheY-like chemotaxis protein